MNAKSSLSSNLQPLHVWCWITSYAEQIAKVEWNKNALDVAKYYTSYEHAKRATPTWP